VVGGSIHFMANMASTQVNQNAAKQAATQTSTMRTQRRLGFDKTRVVARAVAAFVTLWGQWDRR
jgi:hypothetical protein